MAVPTITSVSPATGPAAGGQLITIVGTNFRVPTLVYDIPASETITPTMSATIAGRACLDVRVISATELQLLTPRFWHQNPAVVAFTASDIVLSNLDLTGAVIAGETVTETGGYTYKRWELGAPRPDPPTTRIAKELLRALAVEVTRNTYYSTHVDYGDEGAATVIAEGSLPSINSSFSYPNDLENNARDMYPYEVDKGDGTYDLYEGGKTVQLVADLLVAGGTAGEAEQLCSAIQDFAMVHPFLICSADPTLFDADEEDEYPLEIWGYPQRVGSPVESSMVIFSMQLRVRGIMMLPDDPTMNVNPLTYATMSMQHMDEDGVGDGTIVHTELL